MQLFPIQGGVVNSPKYKITKLLYQSHQTLSCELCPIVKSKASNSKLICNEGQIFDEGFL